MIIKTLNKEPIVWSANFAYCIGLIVTDGSLSKDGRHIDFTSKDKQLIKTLIESLSLRSKIGEKKSGHSQKTYYRTQWSNVNLYKFLISIGIKPQKTKTINKIRIPNQYFFDFLRGHFDGDGTFYSYCDQRWKSSFMFYTVFISANKQHLDWLRKKIIELTGCTGCLTNAGSVYQLKFAKAESLKILSKIYYKKEIPHLVRKKEKIDKALSKLNKQA